MKGSFRAMARRAHLEQMEREREDFDRKNGHTKERLERVCECGHEYGNHTFGDECGGELRKPCACKVFVDQVSTGELTACSLS